MIKPFAQDEAFLESVEAPLAPDDLRVWWLGQSGFLVRARDKRVLFDPYLSDSLTKKYATTDKPHVRMTERVIAPERLTKIDIVTCSHNHTDHLDAETLLPLRQANPAFEFVFPEANRAFIEDRLGEAMHPGLGLAGESSLGEESDDGWIKGVTTHTDYVITESGVSVISDAGEDWNIRAIPSAHNELSQNEAGCHRFVGYVLTLGEWTIYHSGDTLLYPGLDRILRMLGPIDLALLPINGNKPERRVAGNLDGREAAELAHAIGARCVVPCHYEMFEFNTADPQELFVPACERLGQPYRILRAGEGMTLTTSI